MSDHAPKSSSPTAGPIRLSDRDFQSVCTLVHDLAGIHLNDNKRELVVARLSKRIRQLGLSSVGAYLTYIREQRTQDELVSMLDAISTNLTSFWREAEHFKFLVQHLLPRIVLRAKQTRQWTIRAWSAGCSSGEESYGLAMLMLNELEGLGRFDLRILATDLSTRILDVARKGVYSEERVKAVPPDIRQRYFHSERSGNGRMFHVVPDVRSVITYARLNLMETWPMKGPFDLIFCRNVMIYFDKPTQAQLVRRFHEALRPGGVLFIGHSESLTGIEHSFRYLRPTIYERT